MSINDEDSLFAQLPNGINLYTNGLTQSAESWANDKWNIKNARVFKAIHPSQFTSYLFVIEDTPEFESSTYEDLLCHIDICGLSLQED